MCKNVRKRDGRGGKTEKDLLDHIKTSLISFLLVHIFSALIRRFGHRSKKVIGSTLHRCQTHSPELYQSTKK